MVQRLSHTHILERILAFDVRVEQFVAGLVHADEDDPVFGAFEHLDVGCLLQARYVLRRRIVDQVDLAGYQRCNTRRVGSNRRVQDIVDVALEESALMPHQAGFFFSTVLMSGWRETSE